MLTGVCKFFNLGKGWGFIKEDNGDDIFVHYSGIISEDEFKVIREGDKVSFDIEVQEGKKNPCAVNVRVIEKELKD